MNEHDILEVIKLLKSATEFHDWNEVDEAIFYLEDHTSGRGCHDEE
jgi:hypothetical protein